MIPASPDEAAPFALNLHPNAPKEKFDDSWIFFLCDLCG